MPTPSTLTSPQCLWLTMCPSLLQRNGLVSSTSRPPVALMVLTSQRLRQHVELRELSLLLLFSSLLPSRYVGPRNTEPSLGGPSSWTLGLSSQHPLLSLQLGFHLCLVGWLANGSAAHPVVFPAADCGDGQVGIVSLGTRKNLSERWDAYCYRAQGAATPTTFHSPVLPLSTNLPTY